MCVLVYHVCFWCIFVRCVINTRSLLSETSRFFLTNVCIMHDYGWYYRWLFGSCWVKWYFPSSCINSDYIPWQFLKWGLWDGFGTPHIGNLVNDYNLAPLFTLNFLAQNWFATLISLLQKQLSNPGWPKSCYNIHQVTPICC